MTATPASARSESPPDVEAVSDGVAAVRRFLSLEPPTLRRADVEALTGVPHERSVRWWRAMGFADVPSDVPAFREQDVAMVLRIESLLAEDIIDEAEVLRLARLMGAAFSRLVDAQIEVIDELLTRPDESSGRIDPAMLAAAADTDVMELLETTLVYVWRRHLLAALGRRIGPEDEDPEQAIGFVDLSSFSRVTKKATNAEITEIIDAFEAVAFDVVASHDGRVIKLIGDEVMFTTADLDGAVDIGLEMITRLAPVEQVPDVHCGIAYGSTVTVGGDVFGPTVNLASRLTDIARRGTVALPADLAGRLRERADVEIRPVRRTYDLKGVGRTSIVALRPR